MILKSVEKEILRSQKRGEFIAPFYDKFCLSNLPATILDLFSIKAKKSLLPWFPEKYRKLRGNRNLKIVLFVIDGLGYYQWLNHYKNFPFFKQVTERSALLPLTTVFPSTTAAAITTLQTGLAPQEHALFEWYVYMKEIDEVIMTLPFSHIKERLQDQLLREGIKPGILLKSSTIHRALYRHKITSYSYNNDLYAKSAYNSLAFQKSEIVPHKSFSDLAVSLRKKLESKKGRAFFYVYWPDIDAIAHKFGPSGEEYRTSLSAFSLLWENEFLRKLDKKKVKDILLLITADHGQIPVEPVKTLYLNKYQWLIKNFQKSRRGKTILPCGSPRDVFLHIRPESLEDTKIRLSKILKSKAWVLTIKEALGLKFFGGGKVSKKFPERAGNLLVIPRKNNTIWYEHIKGRKFKHRGHHGGLSKEELLIPLALVKLSDLLK